MASGPYRVPDSDNERGDQVVSLADRGRPYAPPPDLDLEQRGPEHGGPKPPPPPPPIDPSLRKLAARKLNESVKLVASGLSSIGIGLISLAFIQSLFKNATLFVQEHKPIWYLVGVVLHAFSHFILHTELRKEE